MTTTVARHRTALTRTRLSRPVALALDDNLLGPDLTFFDYGCGRGDDIRHLTALGIAAAGWDPTHHPAVEHRPADVVNLGYVTNVIEDPHERAETLRAAWSLTRRRLVVAARLNWDARGIIGRPLGDGILTATGTFQKFYTHPELGAWIETTLETKPIAAAPGVFYLFRHNDDAQAFLARRAYTYTGRPTPLTSEALYERNQQLLAPLISFLTEHARLPRPGELDTADIRESLGSLPRAWALIQHVTDPDQWTRIRAQRAADLLTYIGLSRFEHRPRLTELPIALRNDIKDQFGTYRDACRRADRLLLAAGRTDLIDLAARSSPVGKLTPTALYLHRTALGHLPPVLRVYEGCARALAGTVTDANLIKLAIAQPQVSYLAYPDFDRNAHPTLAAAIVVNLAKLTIDLRDYTHSTNPPLLHRKEEFLTPDDHRRGLYARLTAHEIRAGLYQHPERIGTLDGWQHELDRLNREIRGHRLRRRGSPVGIDSRQPVAPANALA
jgi:DNA phosphorothioation-associated putative methyltransferase